MELIKVNKTDNTALARDVYDSVFIGQKSKTSFSHWFSRTINKYGFIENKDFQSFLTKSNGGRPIIDYVVTLDMAKELCMVSPTEKGKEARQYFIKCEKLAKEAYANSKAIRAIGKEVRKSLTDAVQESGEQERMHGHGYSQYTKMVYEIVGIKDIYKEYKKKYPKGTDFREHWMTPDELKRVELAESLIKPLLELDKQYSEIKDTLKPLFEGKEIK